MDEIFLYGLRRLVLAPIAALALLLAGFLNTLSRVKNQEKYVDGQVNKQDYHEEYVYLTVDWTRIRFGYDSKGVNEDNGYNFVENV